MDKKKRLAMRTTSAAVCVLLAANQALPVCASGVTQVKDENVYVNLEQDGSVSDIYVVNEYGLKQDTAITDHGDYSSVKNLTDNQELVVFGDEVTFDASKGKFYYQGELNTKEMPWNIDISYKLDGEEISADELPGKSGSLEINISIKENKKCDKDFFDNYLLQATVLLDTEKCSDIETDGATEGNLGDDRQLLYNIMAGTEKEIHITAQVKDFEMDGISFLGVPMSFDIDKEQIDDSELKEKTDELKDGVEELDDGATELNDGAGKLDDGAKDAVDGSDSLKTGSKELQKGLKKYTNGTSSLATGIKKYIGGTGQLYQGAKQLAPLENLDQIRWIPRFNSFTELWQWEIRHPERQVFRPELPN